VANDLRTTPPRLAAAQPLFTTSMAGAAGLVFISNYDAIRTGDRFLVARPPEAQNIHQQLTAIVNWLPAD
jgi:hypothetical protein